MASVFSVVLLTAAPPGMGVEAAGATVKIDGREALLRSVELFLNRDNVKQVLLVVDPESMEESKRKYGAHLGFSGVKLASGGPKWVDQVGATGPLISPDATHVILHDAARPAVAYSDIDNLMTAAETSAAVALATPVRSVLVETDDSGAPVNYHLPQQFMHLLTPQAFTRAKYLEMAASKLEISPSQVTLVKGSPLNVRVGGPGDAPLLKTMINMLPKPKVKAPDGPFGEAQW
jgi:2-C-methyl-D-erythritol 4-phosphate cytidylyltransferase